MKHLSSIQDNDAPKSLLDRATGRFYTPETIGRPLAREMAKHIVVGVGPLVAIDPFCGDGRLVAWLIEEAVAAGLTPPGWTVCLWDIDADAVDVARRRIEATAREMGVKVAIDAMAGDSFARAADAAGDADALITNPPWERLKPDRREQHELLPGAYEQYVTELRAYDRQLAAWYPLSAPVKKFSGWGTNLARVGTELSLRLVRPGGVAGVVSPPSLLGDQDSLPLRRHLLRDFRLESIDYFPAEARLFEGVDQPAIAFVAVNSRPDDKARVRTTVFGTNGEPSSVGGFDLDPERIARAGYYLPTGFGVGAADLLVRLEENQTFGSLETPQGLWAGRELDETSYETFVRSDGEFLFVKGRMIERWRVAEHPTQYVDTELRRIPPSASHPRIAWRDVSRPNQRRRVQASLIPAGWVAGNSLSVAYFRDDDLVKLSALLALVNSLVFEFQVRARLSTGHVSLGTVRQVGVPEGVLERHGPELAELASRRLAGDLDAEALIETRVAQLYGLDRADFDRVVRCFPKVTDAEREALLAAWPALTAPAGQPTVLANHKAARLSELDLLIVSHVPPGGNWKDIPVEVPSQRLAQIRVSYAAGEGSRSTYYGRLRPDAPSYTINTYFTRPGNGCHIHYAQDRVLSAREAARLQSFPDSFEFLGSGGSVATQIGNAVPPLLAYQVAGSLGKPGTFVDLFAGAGGLSLGFTWAGWQPLVATDLDPVFLSTHARNIDAATVPGDLRDPSVFNEVVERTLAGRAAHPDRPLWVVGGPPCQGFSTAGNRRSMEDERNHLFRNYREFLDATKPDGFVFENVSGLLNMEGGRVLRLVQDTLRGAVEQFEVWSLHSEQFAVPQRRHRLFLVGWNDADRLVAPPVRTADPRSGDTGPRAAWATVVEAIDDLPELAPGQDGTALPYRNDPRSAFQMLMRGQISPADYLTERAPMGEVTEWQLVGAW